MENEQLGEVQVSVSQDECQEVPQRFVVQATMQSAREKILDVLVPPRQCRC